MAAAQPAAAALMGEINVVPYIDVMLVLLIIFMITAPLLTRASRWSCPRRAEPIPPEMLKDSSPSCSPSTSRAGCTSTTAQAG